MTTRKVLLLSFCLLLAACNLPQNPASGARAWIDAPLDGSTLPLAPYEIIFHAFAPENPAAVKLAINGQSVDVISPDLTHPLASIHYLWNPDQPGRYILAASSQDKKGNWSSPYIHTVMIEAFTATPTLTSTPTATSTPTLTSTPTFTLTPSSTRTFTPTATLLPKISILKKSADQFYYGARTCGPLSVQLEVQVSDPLLITGVTLYFHLKDQASGETTPWNEGVQMRPEGNGKFTMTVASQSIPSYSNYRTSLFLYQFVGTDSKYAVVVRSAVYSDITLTNCVRIAITPIG